VFSQQIREAIQMTKRRWQIVRYGVSKGLQFSVRRGKLGASFDDPLFQFLIEPLDLFRGTHAHREVTDGGGDQHRPLSFQRTEADFDREFSSAVAQRPEFDTDARRPRRPGMRHKTSPVPTMLVSETFWNQQFNGLPDQLSISKQRCSAELSAQPDGAANANREIRQGFPLVDPCAAAWISPSGKSRDRVREFGSTPPGQLSDSSAQRFHLRREAYRVYPE